MYLLLFDSLRGFADETFSEVAHGSDASSTTGCSSVADYMSGLCWCDTTATSFNFSLLQYTNPSMHQHRSLHKNCTNSWVPTRVVPVPRPVLKNAADVAKNVCIDTGEYPSRCTDLIPGHLEIGPCYFLQSYSSVSSASKQVPWVSLRELTDTRGRYSNPR